MEDLKDKIIYLQDELIQCLKQINYLERDKRGIESIKNNEIEKLKKEIIELQLEKMQREFHKCENKEYSCDDVVTYSNKIPTIDFILPINNCCDKEYREEAI